ncbi:MAG: hypothetical protein LBV19_06160 [Streptococcaceae bacterium]|jgi:hypothetical protein|nr:hypothetical protein [Streptococcaceae bacterium]
MSKKWGRIIFPLLVFGIWKLAGFELTVIVLLVILIDMLVDDDEENRGD